MSGFELLKAGLETGAALAQVLELLLHGRQSLGALEVDELVDE
jgi:hypothetical protein